MNVAVAGATGLIGKALVRELLDAGHSVVALTRKAPTSAEHQQLPAGAKVVQWSDQPDRQPFNPEEPWIRAVAESDAVVNLAGASIGGPRWTERRKRLLRESRVLSTGALVAAMETAQPGQRPKVLVNASGIDYYGNHASDERVTEDSPPGQSFLARLCVEWEAAARKAEPLGVRVVLMRTAVVIDRDALAFRLLILPFRLFAGGPLGNGRQWFTWIHRRDIVGLYRFAIENAQVQGPLNAVAPDVRQERAVAKAIGKTLNRPAFAPAPSFALRLVLGEQADLLLHGRYAVPERALATGYEFVYPRLEPALAEALGHAQAAPPTPVAPAA
ncbi:MAG TPA: TIGR01777 family oxidoreductase [Chloroflexota bacterium]|nr:TIGR01777 family oxidoreductase [Chloroflexota bacterium]